MQIGAERELLDEDHGMIPKKEMEELRNFFGSLECKDYYDEERNYEILREKKHELNKKYAAIYNEKWKKIYNRPCEHNFKCFDFPDCKYKHS